MTGAIPHTLSDHQEKPCAYCNRPMDVFGHSLRPTRDHYPIPKSRGGRTTIICCYTCNHLKKDMTAKQWQAFMLENKGGWFATRSPGSPMPATPQEPPVSVPAKPLPIDHTKKILQFGTRAYRKWEQAGFPDDFAWELSRTVGQSLSEDS